MTQHFSTQHFLNQHFMNRHFMKMKRVVVPEFLDTDSGTPQQIAGSLADLRMINQRFGGIRTMAALIRRVAAELRLDSLSWLDVAGGSGDVVTLTRKSLAKEGIQVKPVLLDRAASHLTTDYPCVCADAMALPFPDNSFDIVSSTLFLHHLDPQPAAAFVEEALRVSRYAVLINDLVRHPLHLALAYAGYPLYRSAITRHDAVASVRRAYTVDEVSNILERTSAATTEVRTFFLFRLGVIAWKRASTT